MEINGSATALSPSEATFIEDLCRFNSADAELVAQLRGSILEWGQNVLPESFWQLPKYMRTYPMIQVSATRQWETQPTPDLPIKLHLSTEQLNRVHELATIETFEAEERASSVDINFKILNLVARYLLAVEDDSETELSDADLESLKSDIFEEELNKVVVANHIIATIVRSRAA